MVRTSCPCAVPGGKRSCIAGLLPLILTKWEKKGRAGCCGCSCCLPLLVLLLLLLLVLPVLVLPPLPLLLLMGLHNSCTPLSLLPSSCPCGSTTAAPAVIATAPAGVACILALTVYACLLLFSLPSSSHPCGPSHCYCGHCCWCCCHCWCCGCCCCLSCVYTCPPHMCMPALVLPCCWCPVALIIVPSPGLCLYQIHVSKCIVVILLTFKGRITYLK